MDTTSMEGRLNRVLMQRPQPLTQSDGKQLTFWEQELIESRKQDCPQVPLEADNETEEILAPAKKSHASRQPPELIPGTAPNEIIYSSKGRRSGGVFPTSLNNEDDGYESDAEPVSSSNDLVGQFCVFSQVTKFPYKYMQDPESRVSRRFFASQQIYERGWDMYYLYGPDSYASKPLMLVPLVQTERLIQDIKDEFEVDVSVPEYPFHVSFYKDGTPTPTYIGQVSSKADLADVQSKIPYMPDRHNELSTNATELQKRDHAAWTEKLDRVHEAEKKKKNSKNHRKKHETTFPQGSIERAQRYLGLQPKPPIAQPVHPRTTGTQQDHTNKPLDMSLPVPHPFEDNPVLISFDVESWEMNHTAITEIGLSILDTKDIESFPPGSTGEEWIKKIRSRHFRIKGRESLRNMRFCEGNPDMFQFGKSEYVTIEDAADAVDACFEYPYSAGYECEGPPETDKDGYYVVREPESVSKVPEIDDGGPPRTLLLVGHGIDGDIAYLASLGSTIFGTKSVPSSNPVSGPSRRQRVVSSIREQFDTARLYQAFSKEPQTTSLTKVCNSLGITAWYAHNAGNDARYTLEAFVKIVIRARQGTNEQDGSSQKKDIPDVRQQTSSRVNEETTMKTDTSGDVEAETARWTGPQTEQERDWRPIKDISFNNNWVVDSDDEVDGQEAYGSSDEMPY